MNNPPPVPQPVPLYTAEEIALAVRVLRALRGGEASSPPGGEGPADGLVLVTLDQAAALVHRSKRTLEHYRDRMPPPAVEGGGGRPHLWDWAVLRDWLRATFRVKLPEHPPRC